MQNSRPATAEKTTVCALYKFVSLPDYRGLREPLRAALTENNIRGTVLLAQEGINGTISGTAQGVERFLRWLKSDARLADLDCKLSYHSKQPFNRTKVKLKKEIVTMGVPDIDPNKVVGTYVDANDWNDIISDPDTLLIDTRNEYEYGIGTFKNAINPNTDTFREFPDYVKHNLDPQKNRKVAMFCTGGIRCEKASAFMREQGFEQVYHLQGGVLRYLEQVDEKESLWDGECFVFDDRVAVNHKLERGQYDQCHACRYPITETQKESEFYIPGVSCPRCYATLTEEQKARFAERERQVQLAKRRGESHIGSDTKFAAERHRREKLAEKKQQRTQNKC